MNERLFDPNVTTPDDDTEYDRFVAGYRTRCQMLERAVDAAAAGMSRPTYFHNTEIEVAFLRSSGAARAGSKAAILLHPVKALRAANYFVSTMLD